jgi:stage II sporulation protein D
MMAGALTLPGWWPWSGEQESPKFVDTSKLSVSVYLSQQKKTAVYPLETYVRGVLAAEMPAAFELEALKAQAIASRTYIYKRLVGTTPRNLTASNAGGQALNSTASLVTDTVAHQAFLTDDKLKQIWGAAEFDRRIAKIERAVTETEGIVVTFAGQPIDASFFSTSNGRTENSEDYWTNTVPYLRSVSSPWDKAVSPKFKQVLNIRRSAFIQALGLPNKSIAVSKISYTSGRRVQAITIGTKSFTGREVREKLRLPSTTFKLKPIDDSIQVTTYGYGHGIGMSQYGAQGMALAGYKADQILRHYYTGVALEKISQN